MNLLLRSTIIVLVLFVALGSLTVAVPGHAAGEAAAPLPQTTRQPSPQPSPTLGPPPPPEITARGAILVDDQTGAILYERNAHQRFAPASTTKIVTALVALERDYLEHVVRVNVHWQDFYDSTLMGLEYGERLTLDALVTGMLLYSGNDASTQIAKHLAGDEPSFAKLMNEKGKQLGLTNSNFVNPHGLDADNQYSTAHDLTVLGRYGMKNRDFARISGTKGGTVYGIGVYPLRNTNRLVYYYPGADGIKTGFTDEAGLALVATAQRNGRRAFATVMKSQNNFLDCQKLLDYYFENYDALMTATSAGRPLSGGGSPSAALAPVKEWTTPAWPKWLGHSDDRRTWEEEFRYFHRGPKYWIFQQPAPAAPGATPTKPVGR